MHRSARTLARLAFPLKQGSICPWYGVLMNLTVGDVHWLLGAMAFSGDLEEEVYGLRGITYNQMPLHYWLPGEEFPNGGRGGPPFFVHEDWVPREELRLIPGFEIPLQLHVNHEHVFLSGETWPTGTRAITEEVSYRHIMEAALVVATPEEFPPEFRRLAALDPRRAGEVLERGGLEALGGLIRLPVERLESTDLRELLICREVAVSEYANSWLNREQGVPATPSADATCS